MARESSRRPEVSPGAPGLTASQASVASLHILLTVVASKSHWVILCLIDSSFLLVPVLTVLLQPDLSLAKVLKWQGLMLHFFRVSFRWSLYRFFSFSTDRVPYVNSECNMALGSLSCGILCKYPVHLGVFSATTVQLYIESQVQRKSTSLHGTLSFHVVCSILLRHHRWKTFKPFSCLL